MLTFLKIRGAWSCSASVYNNRLVLKMPELQPDIAAVITTKFIMAAAAVIPTLANVNTNGEPRELISSHG